MPIIEALRQYVITENPSDFPGMFVVRGWSILAGDVPAAAVPDATVRLARTLEDARRSVPAEADFCIERSPDDDPAIVETWM